MKDIIAHTADNHLRDSQYARTSRGHDFTNALLQALDKADNANAKVVLCSGDLLNVNRPSSKNLKDLVQVADELERRDMTMLVITGDHDRCYPSWTEVLEKLLTRDSKPSRIVNIDFTLHTLPSGLTIYGVPALKPEEFRERVAEFPDADILMYHGLIREWLAFSKPEALSLDELPTDRYKAILLGDLHTNKYVVKDGCVVGYPGPTELCSSSETEQKHIRIFEWENHEIVGPPTGVNIDLHTRLVLKLSARDETEFTAALQTIRSNSSSNPLIFLKYDIKDVASAFARITSIVDPRKAIIKLQTLSRPGLGSLMLKGGSADMGVLKPEDYVGNYFTPGTELHSIATTLCNPEEKPGVVLEKFIDNKLDTFL